MVVWTMTTNVSASQSQRISVGGGRSLAVRQYGRSDGRPVVLLHGTPGSGLLFTGTDQPARDLGFCIFAPDRWGYGRSDGHPEPSLSAFAEDVEAMMAAVGHRRFGIGGVSGGGPYAAAVAARLGPRVAALALISPVGLVTESVAAGEVGLFHRFCFGPLAARPRAVERIFDVFAWSVEKSPKLACGLTTLRAPKADKRVMADCVVSERLLRAFQEGLAPGSAGPAIDLALFGAPWRVDPSIIAAPTAMWIGTRDSNVPIAAARRLAERIPRATVSLLEGHGHLWVAQNYRAILDWFKAAWIDQA
jgi:pimeloyl-ACP methyl ester carboxylesterase